MMSEHGQAAKYYHDLERYRRRLDAIPAELLRVKLGRLDEWNEQRRSAAARYTALLSSVPGITVPFEPKNSRAVHHLYVVRNANRDPLADHLKSNGVSSGLHYPLPLHLQKCYCEMGYAAGSLPVTERAAAEVLSLPMFPGITPSQQSTVVSALRRFESPAPSGSAHTQTVEQFFAH